MNSNKRWQHLLQGAIAVLSLALLTSCGGGKREVFHPNHMYMFGDEFTYIDVNNPSTTTTDGVRYTVNTVLNTYTAPVTGTSYNPLAYASWPEYLAGYYGKIQQPCANTSISAMSMCSGAGTATTVADTIAAINTKAFQKDELVVIMAGTRDILNAYQSFKSGGSIDTLATTVKNAGIALGQKINAITDTGARVAVATIPDIGLSPYAINESAVSNGGTGSLRNYGVAIDCSPEYRPTSTTDRSQALSYLTTCFNNGLRGLNGIKNDGKKIALISTFDWTILVARSPATYGIADAFNAACPSVTNSTAATYNPETCLNTTAVSNPAAYLWSFGPWFGPGGHVLLGQRAINQVNLNWGE